MPKQKLRVSLNRRPAMHVTKVSIGKDKLVYAILADKKVSYPTGRSRVVYLGTTKKGIGRIARSVAARAKDILDIHGVQEFTVRVITCHPRKNVKTWFKLERAMLLVFKDIYGKIPRCNKQGKRMKERDEFKYFRRKRIERILDELR